MRQLVIGDVHGCAQELEALIQLFAPQAGDEIYQVGDLINKGPDTAACLRLVEKYHIQCVRGNHEAKLLRIFDTPLHLRSPKEQAFLDRLGSEVLNRISQIRSWPLWIDTPLFTVVHAGLEPGKSSLEEMSAKVLLSIRTWDGEGVDMDNAGDPPWFDCIQWPKKVVFGHWALLGIVQRPQVIGLDSGCVYGKKLTGWCPQEDRFYQVEAHQEYIPLIPGIFNH